MMMLTQLITFHFTLTYVWQSKFVAFDVLYGIQDAVKEEAENKRKFHKPPLINVLSQKKNIGFVLKSHTNLT